MKVFLDTNIVMDVLRRREPFYGHSVRVWALAEGGQICGVVSAVSFTNVYYIVRRLMGRRAAQQAVVLMRHTFEMVATDAQTLNQAIDAGFSDFEDAVQYFSALRCGAACLVTRNPKHFPKEGIPVHTPTEFLAAHFPE